MKRYSLLLISAFVLGTCAPLGAAKKEAPTKQEASEAALLEQLKSNLNNPLFAQNVLPHDFSSLLDLLRHGKMTGQPRDFTRSVFKLFANQMKRAQYVNPGAIILMLETLPALLRAQFVLQRSQRIMYGTEVLQTDAMEYFRKTINTLMFNKFTDEYEEFRKEPEQFLEQLSHQIVDLTDESITIDQLRQSIIRFLEVAIGKLIWSPADGVRTWESVKTISKQLHTLLDQRIIDDANDLDDLYWTLVHRYCFFLDLTSTDLNPECYAAIRADVKKGGLPLLDLEEQEDFIEPKKKVLMRSVLAGERQRREAAPPTQVLAHSSGTQSGSKA